MSTYSKCLPLFIVLSSFIECSVIPDKSRIVEHRKHDESTTKILYQLSWFIHFIKNLSDYFIIIIPVGILVLLVKHTNLLPSSIKQITFVKFLVYGVQNENKLLEDGLPLVQSDLDRKLKSERPREKNTSIFHLLYCFWGLQISFLIWGILQEKIMTQNYVLKSSFLATHDQISDNLISIVSIDSQNTDIIYIKFRNAQFLVLFNRVLAFTIALTVFIYQNHRHKNLPGHRSFFKTKQPPFYMYIYCSLSNILSSWCQYEALKYVSFPAQVLSKGCKMIPTMLMNIIIMGKSQKREEWLFALAISFGMTIFLLNEQHESHYIDQQSSLLDSSLPSNLTLFSGSIILALYLTFDSFTSNWQQSLFDQYPTLTSLHMMAAVNFYSILFTLISLIQQSDFFPAISLIFANPTLLRDCVVLSICSAGGQLFIFHTISTFGAIIFTLIMTLRQALAILLSCFIYSHSITWLGLLGILIIFASLFTKSYMKFNEMKHRKTTITIGNKSKSNQQNVI